jgi:asparagine synthase (glutamine-hydrolysing)
MPKTTIRRSRTGSTPLFYCIHNGQLYHSASIRELFTISGTKPCINSEGIAAITLMGPGRPLHNAVFSGVRELPPGYQAVYENGKLEITQYWKPRAIKHNESFEETSAHARDLLTKSIEHCLNKSDRQCLFLSGGLDSSIIGAVMKQSGVPINSYSVDYTGNSDNFKETAFSSTEDAPFVAEMADFLKSEHRNIFFDAEDLFGALKDAVSARGFPAMADVDSAMMLFCGEVAKECESALSGECADEIFGGYKWYFDEELLHCDDFPWIRSIDGRIDLLRENILKDINPHEYIKSARDSIIKNVDYLDSDDELSRRRREMFCLNYYGFMQTLSERAYTMSGDSLQILMPFSNAEVAEYAFNIPWEMKSFMNREKGLLRHAFGDIMPESVAWRKKSPFPKTHNPQYMRLVTSTLCEIVKRDDCRIVEIYDKNKLDELIRKQGSSFKENWFGQLMSVPQIFAYLIQLEFWLREFDVQINP